MQIYLCGFMGSGKTTLMNRMKNSNGKTPFLDLDTEILNRNSNEFESLAELIEKQGWDYFRSQESKILRELIENGEEKVVALGGGTLETQKNLELLLSSEQNTLVYLDIPFEVCWQRISKENGRPMVKKGREALETLYSERLAQYRRASVSLDNDAQIQIASLCDLKRLIEG